MGVTTWRPVTVKQGKAVKCPIRCSLHPHRGLSHAPSSREYCYHQWDSLGLVPSLASILSPLPQRISDRRMVIMEDHSPDLLKSKAEQTKQLLLLPKMSPTRYMTGTRGTFRRCHSVIRAGRLHSCLDKDVWKRAVLLSA